MCDSTVVLGILRTYATYPSRTQLGRYLSYLALIHLAALQISHQGQNCGTVQRNEYVLRLWNQTSGLHLESAAL